MVYPLPKRLFDLALGVPLFALSVPVIVLAGAAILAADGWPVFYSQEREGLHGKRFALRKLRTMRRGSQELLEKYLSENPAARAEWERRFKLEDDPRVIPAVGVFLRRLNIDELPQFWNVLRGEMSLVGPRPFPRYHLERFSPAWRAERASVRPGVTGLWQVTAVGEDSLEVQERIDREYLARRSPRFDLALIGLTAKKVLSGGKGIATGEGGTARESLTGR